MSSPVEADGAARRREQVRDHAARASTCRTPTRRRSRASRRAARPARRPSIALTVATSFLKTIPSVIGKFFVSCRSRAACRSCRLRRRARARTSRAPTRRACAARREGRRRGARGRSSGPSRPAARSRQRSNAYGAARAEPAAGGRPQERRRLAADLHQPLEGDVDPRQRAEQPPRVRVQRALEQLEHGRLLGDPGRVHDDDVVGRLGDDARGRA